MYGALAPNRQLKVFRPAERGSRKVVVATNIAETSITIGTKQCCGSGSGMNFFRIPDLTSFFDEIFLHYLQNPCYRMLSFLNWATLKTYF
jgi:hypothetical protein